MVSSHTGSTSKTSDHIVRFVASEIRKATGLSMACRRQQQQDKRAVVLREVAAEAHACSTRDEL